MAGSQLLYQPFPKDRVLERVAARGQSQQAQQAEGYPNRDVFGFGYSNGANILASDRMAHPDLFCRVRLLHPLDPVDPGRGGWSTELSGSVHSRTSQSDLPLPMTDWLVFWTKVQGANMTTAFHDGGHQLRRTKATARSAFLAAQSSEAAA